MEHHTTTSRAEAERLMGLSEKLLHEKDYGPCKDFALLAQETEPLLEGPDQILAIADVMLASAKRVNNHHDWYSILQIPGRIDDQELVKKQYRKLALLLHPDKNKYPSADSAFGLVADAWAVLSDPGKKVLYDNELSLFARVNLVPNKRKNKKNDEKLPVRRSARSNNYSGPGSGSGQGLNPGQTPNPERYQRPKNATPISGGVGGGGRGVVNFWTACPYCYNLYEYPKVYEGCCLRCEGCKRAFTAAQILSMPPLVPGREAYYCIWGFFPMGFVNGSLENGKVVADGGGGGEAAFPTWMPNMFQGGGGGGNVNVDVNVTNQNAGTQAQAQAPAQAPVHAQAQPQASRPMSTPMSTGAKKRGRPRKYT